ncbi:unnamed protein product [Cunninghamella blakesleeana]
MNAYGYYIATTFIYGALLGMVILLGFVKRSFFPYLHLGLASVSAVQYLAMFLIPVYVAHRRVKLISPSKTQPKPKTVKILVVIGNFFAFVAVVLLIGSLATLGTSFSYYSITVFAHFHLIHAVIHWAIILLCLVIAGVLNKEIPNYGSFLAFVFFIFLMMAGVTVNLFIGVFRVNGTIGGTIAWVYIFLYHVCCFIAIIISAFFGPYWIQDTKSLDYTETVA